jgi:hypothetical protein
VVDIDALEALLEASTRRPRVRLESLAVVDLLPADIAELHVLASRMMTEPYAHFAAHVRTNDTVHIFREVEGGQIAGFQFWRSEPARCADERCADERCADERCADEQSADERIVLGGKLRVRPDVRRRGLHLVSGLCYYLEQAPLAVAGRPLVRMSIASLFGFVSIARHVDYAILVDGEVDGWVCDEMERLATESGFVYDRATGLVHVGMAPTADELAAYPPEFYASPTARAFFARNPRFPSDPRFVAFAFRYTEDNVDRLYRAAAERSRA